MPDEKQPTQATASPESGPAHSAADSASSAPAGGVAASASPSATATPPRPNLAENIKAIVTSVPGMFTALAGSVAAITALLTALNNASWMHPATPTPVPTVVAVATVPATVAAMAAAQPTPAPAIEPVPATAVPATLVPTAAPSATPAPTATLMPTSLPSVLIETFADAASGWEQHEGDDYACGYRDGGYFVRVTRPQEVVWITAPGGRVFRDVSVELDVRRIAGPEDNTFGIVARVAPAGRFYFFAISSDGYAAVQMSEGESWRDLREWQSTPAIKTGETNRLRAELLGKALRFSVNGTLVAEVTDGALAEGEIGLAAGSFDVAGVEILFDNLRIEAIAPL